MTKEVALATVHEAAAALLALEELRRLYSSSSDIEAAELEQLRCVLEEELAAAMSDCGNDVLQDVMTLFDGRNESDRLMALTAVSFLAITNGDADASRIGAPIEEVMAPLWEARKLACKAVRDAAWRVHDIQYNHAIIPSFAELTPEQTLARIRSMLRIYSQLAREFDDPRVYAAIGAHVDDLALTFTYVGLRIIRCALLLPEVQSSDDLRKVVYRFAAAVHAVAAADDNRSATASACLPLFHEALDMSDGITAHASSPVCGLTKAEGFFLGQVRRDLRARYDELAEADDVAQSITPAAVLEMCAAGETDNIEFKSGRADLKKILKEVVAMLNTATGGVILFGVEDDGSITGIHQTHDELDQALQNSIRANVVPAPSIRLETVAVDGVNVAVIRVPRWNGRDVYHFDHRIYVRKGTNAFIATPDEARALYLGHALA